MKLNVHWFRRDLRLHDNTALNAALAQDLPVLPIFIFDDNILNDLQRDDSRVTFIYDTLSELHAKLQKLGSSLLVLHGRPDKVLEDLLSRFSVGDVFTNRDYEPYATERDNAVSKLLVDNDSTLRTYKDHVIFEKDDILKADGKPYTVYTPYKRRWLERFDRDKPRSAPGVQSGQFVQQKFIFPQLKDIGFVRSAIKVPQFNLDSLDAYAAKRDFPAAKVTSGLGPYLRFGQVSVREILDSLDPGYEVFQSELIWREFFSQILWHFPHVIGNSFKPQYDRIPWRNDQAEFERWCSGTTGYPLVDAGMRELNATGLMHNRVRMVTASFLCKHLLIDWRLGESYFASKLLDFELASNNGNWQWAAGTGCDAAPYFRVFNPTTQMTKFDPNQEYVMKWVPEVGTKDYPAPVVDHAFARKRAIDTYKTALNPIADLSE